MSRGSVMREGLSRSNQTATNLDSDAVPRIQQERGDDEDADDDILEDDDHSMVTSLMVPTPEYLNIRPHGTRDMLEDDSEAHSEMDVEELGVCKQEELGVPVLESAELTIDTSTEKATEADHDEQTPSEVDQLSEYGNQASAATIQNNRSVSAMNVTSNEDESANPSLRNMSEHDERKEQDIQQHNQETGQNVHEQQPDHTPRSDVLAVLSRNPRPIRPLNMGLGAWVATADPGESSNSSAGATSPSNSSIRNGGRPSVGAFTRRQTRPRVAIEMQTADADPEELVEPIPEGRCVDREGRALQVLRNSADNLSESDRSNNSAVPSVPSLAREPPGQDVGTPTFELQIMDEYEAENEQTFIDLSVNRRIGRIVAITQYGVIAHYYTSGQQESTYQLIQCNDPLIRLTISENGEYLVATQNQVYVFSPEYMLLRIHPLNMTIRDIASDTNGKIHVLLTDGTVRAFQWITDNNYLQPIPTIPGRITHANSIAVHDSVVYITHSEEYRIVRYDLITRASAIFLQDLARPEAVFVEEDTRHIFFCNGYQVRVHHPDGTPVYPPIDLGTIARAVAAIGNSVFVIIRRGGTRVFTVSNFMQPNERTSDNNRYTSESDEEWT